MRRIHYCEGVYFRESPTPINGTAQHGHAADGALRPQDRRFFERWDRLNIRTDLVVRRR